MTIIRSLILSVSLTLVACADSDSDSDTSSADDAAQSGEAGRAAPEPDAGTTKPPSSAVEAPTDESASAAFDGTFEACVAALKPVCGYDDKATACASLTTPSIPLANGESYGDKPLQAGPYGGFVAWNQGKEFANPVNAGESTCAILAGAFGEPQPVTDDILNLRGQDLGLYTIFRPACMKDGEKYPVITWGNGTCGQSGGYASLLATLASHGYVIVSSNSRFTDAGNQEMLKALDYAKALNEDANSLYYQKLDLDKVGAMGHSQGASATANAASDPRIKAVILWNGGLSSAQKPFLAVSGDRDITGYTPMQMRDAVQTATQPGAWLYYHKVLETGGRVTGHLTLMEQPDRVVEPTLAWWNYMLKGDQEARKQFAGDDCGLCKTPEDYEAGAQNLP
jgi:pimeloyl-ACP methyl ester carboxylesterase